MNEHDDPLNEYLRSDSPVSQVYRALPPPQVPDALDARILQRASHVVPAEKVVELKPRAAAWYRWGVPLGVAASVVMALSIFLELHKPVTVTPNEPKATVIYVQAPNGNTVPPPEILMAETDASRQAESRRADVEKNRDSIQQEPADNKLRDAASPAAPPVREALPVAPPMPLSVPAALAADQNIVVTSKAMVQSPAQRSVSNAAPVDKSSAPAKQESSMAIRGELADLTAYHADPKTWLAHIQQLREAGQPALAERELHDFKMAWPAYPLSAEHSSSDSSVRP